MCYVLNDIYTYFGRHVMFINNKNGDSAVAVVLIEFFAQ